MDYFYVALLTSVYFVMGNGVRNMWKVIIEDEYELLVIIFWPLVLIVTSVLDRDG